MKLNIGCGTRLEKGFINADIAPLDGVDLVTDFANSSWPFRDSCFEVVVAQDVLEHLPDLMMAVMEIWRISENKAEVIITTPYWNNWRAVADPTHKRFFHETTFDYFDTEKELGKQRFYYSAAQLRVEHVIMWVHLPFVPRWFPLKWLPLENGVIRSFASILNRPFGFIGEITFRLRVIKTVGACQ